MLECRLPCTLDVGSRDFVAGRRSGERVEQLFRNQPGFTGVVVHSFEEQRPKGLGRFPWPGAEAGDMPIEPAGQYEARVFSCRAEVIRVLRPGLRPAGDASERSRLRLYVDILELGDDRWRHDVPSDVGFDQFGDLPAPERGARPRRSRSGARRFGTSRSGVTRPALAVPALYPPHC